MKKGHILSIFFAVSVSAAAMFGAACSEDAAVITEFDVPSFIEVNVNSENVLPTVTAVSDDGKKYPAAVEITDEAGNAFELNGNVFTVSGNVGDIYGAVFVRGLGEVAAFRQLFDIIISRSGGLDVEFRADLAHGGGIAVFGIVLVDIIEHGLHLVFAAFGHGVSSSFFLNYIIYAQKKQTNVWNKLKIIEKELIILTVCVILCAYGGYKDGAAKMCVI